MKVVYEDKVIFISDTSDKAKKILGGHDYHINDDGDLVIDGVGVSMKNKHQIKKAISKANTINDIKAILNKIADLLD